MDERSHNVWFETEQAGMMKKDHVDALLECSFRKSAFVTDQVYPDLIT